MLIKQWSYMAVVCFNSSDYGSTGTGMMITSNGKDIETHESEPPMLCSIPESDCVKLGEFLRRYCGVFPMDLPSSV